MSKSKDKGKYFEDKIASITREILHLRPHECKRCLASGNEAFEYGDVYFSDPEKFSFVFECKFHEDWTFSSIFPVLSGKMLGFLHEVFPPRVKYRNYFGRDPFLSCVVFSKAYMPIYCLTIDPVYQAHLPHIQYTQTIIDHDIVYPIYMYDFKDVLRRFQYERER